MEHGQLLRQYEGGVHMAGEGDVFPIFAREAVHNETKSLEAGRPIYDTQEQVTIIIPGDPGNSPTRLVSEQDKARFAEAYRRFKAEEEHVFDGQIVESWSILDKAQAASLKHMGFHTIESVANCPDSFMPKLGMGGLMLREKARAHVEASKSGSVPERLVQENAQQRTMLEQQAQTIADLKHMVEKLAADHKLDINKVTPGVETAMSHARETLTSQPGDLPENWPELKVKELIELCKALGTAVTPRNRDEAIQLLSEYQGTRNALK